jgi:hypothetical protein
MRRLVNIILPIIGIVSLIQLTSTTSSAQKLPKRIHIQANAMGTSTQMGRMFSVNIIIEEVTSDQERAGLLEAFQAKGNEGLVNALEKMHAKGRMAITGTLGYDVAYVKVFKQPDGSSVIRMVTNRLLQFGEVWASSRSSDYNLSAIEIVIKNNKYTGTLYPACSLKVNKKGTVELQLYQNPWNLTNIMKR